MVAITYRGKQKLEKELKRLLEHERPIVIKAIEEARAHGDLRENAEYAAAKEKQGFVEGRIAELNTKMTTYEVVDPSKIKSDKVMFGATVEIQNLDNDKISKYQIVGEDESDVSTGYISVMSPISRALISKKQGDIVTVKTPGGEVDYEILKVSYI